jgi:hypothetical protein
LAFRGDCQGSSLQIDRHIARFVRAVDDVWVIKDEINEVAVNKMCLNYPGAREFLYDGDRAAATSL